MTEQEEFEFRQRLEQEQAAPKASVEVRGATEEDLIDPLYSLIGGAFAGQAAGPAANKATEAFQKSRAARASVPAPTAAGKAPAGGFVPTPDQHTRIIQGGVDETGTTGRARQQGYNERTAAQSLERQAAEKNMQDLARRRIITGESPLTKIAAPTSTPSGIIVPGSAVYEAPTPAPAAKPPSMVSKIGASLPQPIQKLGGAIGGFGQDLAAGIGGAAQAGVTPYIGRALAGAGLGFQGTDVFNRLKQGDVPGATISGLGALGSAAAFIPTPMTRFGGAAVGIGAELLNQYLDKLKKQVEGMGQPAAAPAPVQGPLSAPAPAAVPGMAKGGEVLKQLKKLNLADLEGKTLLGTMSDRTKVGGGLKGGPMFPTVHEGAAWAMDAPGAATRLLKAMHGAGGPEQTVVAPMLMSPGAQRSNRDVSKMAVGQFQKNFQEGGFSPERLAEIEARIRSMPGLSSHPGMMDEGAQELMNNLTFAQRKQLVDALASKPKTAQALDLQKLLRETTEPGLQEAPLGAIGPSVFKLSGERSINPELHGSYSHILHGEPVGAINPIPREFLFRDLESKAMKELGRPLSDYNYRTSVGTPSQMIDEKLLRSLEELGYLK